MPYGGIGSGLSAGDLRWALSPSSSNMWDDLLEQMMAGQRVDAQQYAMEQEPIRYEQTRLDTQQKQQDEMTKAFMQAVAQARQGPGSMKQTQERMFSDEDIARQVAGIKDPTEADAIRKTMLGTKKDVYTQAPDSGAIGMIQNLFNQQMAGGGVGRVAVPPPDAPQQLTTSGFAWIDQMLARPNANPLVIAETIGHIPDRHRREEASQYLQQKFTSPPAGPAPAPTPSPLGPMRLNTNDMISMPERQLVPPPQEQVFQNPVGVALNKWFGAGGGQTAQPMQAQPEGQGLDKRAMVVSLINAGKSKAEAKAMVARTPGLSRQDAAELERIIEELQGWRS